ncbi:MAG: tetratricopeptide repeat protein [Candidatus Omnitrophica bacterium]|nr:tetratricopeptide repeat protein [Candidatus Omnitrophota bacterium]
MQGACFSNVGFLERRAGYMFLRSMKLGLGLFVLLGCMTFSLACDKNLIPRLLYQKARNLHDHGKVDKAIEIYKKILTMEGDHSSVNYDLGVAYADKGDIMNAKNQVQVLKDSGRSDLAEVLAVVIRDSNSHRVRKRLQGEYDDEQEKNKK